MILIPSSVEVEFAGGGFGLLRSAESPPELGRLRPIGQILPDVLARYGITAEIPTTTNALAFTAKPVDNA